MVRSVTLSMYNPNAVIVTLYDKDKPTVYHQYNLMVTPCSASTSFSGCNTKFTVCTTCVTNYVLIDVPNITGGKFCSIKKDNKWCLAGYFEINKKCIFDCFAIMALYGNYLTYTCVSATTFC